MSFQTEFVPNPSEFPRLNLILADADSIFRLGLRTGLAQVPQISLIAEVATAATLWETLANLDRSPQPEPPLDMESPLSETRSEQTVVVLGVNGSEDLTPAVGAQIKAQYPTLGVLVLATQVNPADLEQWWRVGIEGCWPKGTSLSALLPILRQVAAAQRCWHPDWQQIAQSPDRGMGATSVVTRGLQPLSLWGFLRQSLRESGFAQMAKTLAELEALLEQPLTPIERLVLEGRCREIRAARRLVEVLLPPAVERAVPEPVSSASPPPVPGGRLIPRSPDLEALVPVESFQMLKAAIFEGVVAKLPTSLQNQTGQPLETDILRADKKQELFLTVLRRFEDLLEELRLSEVTRSHLEQQRSRLLLDLWESTTCDFFGKYRTVEINTATGTASVELVERLLQDHVVVASDILAKIPLVTELLEHLLFQVPLMVDEAACAVGSPEAVRRAEALLENIVVQVSNGVLQPLLNHFATVEVIRQSFFDRRLLSTREIERFRNALSWKYRLRRLVGEPQDIFESQFGLLVFTESGLKQSAIYAPRDRELESLQGIGFAVTLALEARDAIAPPLRATFTFLGQGVVYLLTQVIGRGIGLIGSGILQGVGHTWQDLRTPRKSQSGKQVSNPNRSDL
ncbi:DUF3685 domain-containing protein [Synechococcales cyanobacterium C]|uniref:DUF3685 domain-containing protein n=1 Tax=Petrachloros mirabilis ULC683 TaxID=2781853 RepID=A0A8K1ZVW0_9CYAN|nr:DUF3685 domain-containing protein [Petrachloros mirabilis]NCJ06180.1 DUF3685 domain-containing protein [Petrachloros mirabilis ULC683]